MKVGNEFRGSTIRRCMTDDDDDGQLVACRNEWADY